MNSSRCATANAAGREKARARFKSMPETRRWARCGSGGSSSDTAISIDSLRRGLARAENPQGVLRGSVRPAPPDRVGILLEAVGTTADMVAVFGGGAGVSLGRCGGRPNASSSSSAANAPSMVTITGRQVRLSAPVANQAARRPPAARPEPLDKGKALALRSRHRIVHFVGCEDNCPDAEWTCAICLSAQWSKARLSKMPRCSHCFHSKCVDKWFLRSSLCPSCRQPI